MRAGAGPHVRARQQDADERHDRQVRAETQEPTHHRRGRGRVIIAVDSGRLSSGRSRGRRCGGGARWCRGLHLGSSAHGRLRDRDVDTARDRMSVRADETPPDRHSAWLQDRQRGDDLGVTSRSVHRTAEFAACTRRVDEGDRQRVERHRLVEHPHDMSRRNRQRGTVSGVARNERVVCQYACCRHAEESGEHTAHDHRVQDQAMCRRSRHGLLGAAAPKRQSNYTM